MKKTLNEDLLVSLIDEFLEPFGLDSDFDSDFFYDIVEERVYFTILVSERSDRLFKQYIKNTFNFDVPNIFMMSLLHEIGHAETLENISMKQYKKDHQTKNKLEEELDKLSTDDPNYDIVYSKYFDIGFEKVATEWAVNYYKSHKSEIANFYSKFLKVLHSEFERLGLVE